MHTIKDDVLSYREMCDEENVQTLQRGMNFRLHPSYSVVLMSQRTNAPYKDRIHEDGITLEYEGHDVSKRSHEHLPKNEDQLSHLPSGKLTQNGYFIQAADKYRAQKTKPETVKVYEKIMDGVWSLKGYFDLVEYKVVNDGKRQVFRFILRLTQDNDLNFEDKEKQIAHTRLIPSYVKKEVWKRDGGKCVICGEIKNLHFDHDLPFSKGGTSLKVSNIKLMCMKHNLQKSAKLE